MRHFRHLALLAFVILFTSCSVLKNNIPQPEREFRGFWVATVANIDWPKNGNDPIEKQKQDFQQLLDFYDHLNFNAAIVQVRSAGDALYPTDLAPWSRSLTGKEGQAPTKGQDPLTWLIDQTHEKGMEFHAWLNPYRATMSLDTTILSPDHDFFKHREWMLQYGNRYYYDPGLPEVQEHLLKIIDEVVENYDVDAIHFDDYFYPYKIANETFGDSLSYYNCAPVDMPLEDWRRSNVDSLVKQIHLWTKDKKPWVKFGISPFGVWRNKSTDPRGSDTKAGQTTYDDLYADPLLWMEKGWIDYIAPQVYWSMHYPAASYEKIVDWWSSQNTGTNVYIGNAAYKVRNNSDTAWQEKNELPDQIVKARSTPKVKGNIFFSAKSLMTENEDVVHLLQKRFYRRKAAPPPYVSQSENLYRPKSVKILKNNDDYHLRLHPKNGQRYMLVYQKKGSDTNPKKGRLLARLLLTENDGAQLPLTKIGRCKKVLLTFLNNDAVETEPFLLHLNNKEPL